ncbi:DUF2771 domain-containing protein [Streptomyces sp. NBC_01387]|uniref:DUF2771 domain-containing protein n=1 Tax=unclassified Streptomyces TaxID=2593676 RepID=UPI0020241396|nr:MULTISPECIES: DUF2771 domain-containing protein [unclassified Streptomyces]MCX4550121.1 DUF2771 domain-containing protein [Streptomyces sp. NBC_01500]WSC21618.1 DUF2771 domain-containing protein [Streptomyces sp. NBC_01766]WSV55578.1 DUF2771 domain-containing protein [Streptomyces sp. NBC_01014]
MTVALLTGKGRRTAAAVAAVSAGLLVLSACDKPTPLATVTVGTKSVNTAAACYNDGKALDMAASKSCAEKKKHTPTIKVDPEATVRIGVDPKIADKGWTLLLNGQQLTGVSKKTYTTIPGNVFFNAQYGAKGNTSTVAIAEGDGTTKVYGLWSFTFKKND